LGTARAAASTRIRAWDAGRSIRFIPPSARGSRTRFRRRRGRRRSGGPPSRGDSTLILAPTGSGKTLTAFLWCLNRLMFEPPPSRDARCRVLYISPLKALAADIDRNLQAPLAGIARSAQAAGTQPVSMHNVWSKMVSPGGLPDAS